MKTKVIKSESDMLKSKRWIESYSTLTAIEWQIKNKEIIN